MTRLLWRIIRGIRDALRIPHEIRVASGTYRMTWDKGRPGWTGKLLRSNLVPANPVE